MRATNGDALHEQGVWTAQTKTLAVNFSAHSPQSQAGARLNLGLAVWLWAYRIEEARELHATSCNLWRQAACCVGLAVLRIFGGR